MKGPNINLDLEGAVSIYLQSLPAGGSGSNCAELQRFVRWFGRNKPVSALSQVQVARYVAGLSSSDVDHACKLEQIRGFLAYAKKEQWTTAEIPSQSRSKKTGKQTRVAAKKQLEAGTVVLTREGYETMQKELSDLKDRRPHILDEIRRAAADKDFRENAPLHAAREQLGYMDGRIQELEAALKCASVAGRPDVSQTVIVVGDKVTLVDTASDVASCYILVGIKEASPGKGKISYASPIGKAILGRACGDMVEVEVPSGKLRYRIEHIEHAVH